MTTSSSQKDNSIVIAAIECGGTSFRIAICQWRNDSDRADNLSFLHRAQIYTAVGVAETLRQLSQVLQQYASQIQTVGIASFGPVGLHPERPEEYGCILNASPKQEWRRINLIATVRTALENESIPIRIDTGVNAPAMAEYQAYRKHSKIRSCAYVTVGTGVGVGLVVNDQTVHGMMHPEMGHIAVPPSSSHDPFLGYSWGRRAHSSCPYSGLNTVEGLTSSVALTERYYQRLQQNSSSDHPNAATKEEVVEYDRNILSLLSDDDETWDHAAHVLASLCTALFLSLSMERIVLGGGVVLGRATVLLPKIHRAVAAQLNGYLAPLPTLQHVQERIVLSRHGEDAGLYGAIHLAQEAFLQRQSPNEIANQEDATTTRQKQVAFQYGLWHGIILGVIGTGLCLRYCWKDVEKSRR